MGDEADEAILDWRQREWLDLAVGNLYSWPAPDTESVL